MPKLSVASAKRLTKVFKRMYLNHLVSVFFLYIEQAVISIGPTYAYTVILVNIQY